MTDITDLSLVETDLDALADVTGKVAVLISEEGGLDPAGRRVNRLTRGALARLGESSGFSDMKTGTVKTLALPVGLTAEEVLVAKLGKAASIEDARKVGAALAKAKGKEALTLCLGSHRRAAEVVEGVLLRDYAYRAQRTGDAASVPRGAVQVMVTKPDALDSAVADLRAVASGVFLTRDLINAPANVLTTESFAEQMTALGDLGVQVEVLEEAELERLGMRLLLAVGQGSESPSKVVVMRWEGGEGAPLAFVGKGVVFDTGGISLKPAGGMEDMTMDMGGAGVVAGVMHAIAARKAKANVVGLIGLVENMPSGRATRPGDVVASMKGDTVEIINTDAEGRLVLADVLWYTQDRFEPRAIVDLATLTGAIIVALGHENAGVFSNDDAFVDAFLSAARAEGEGAWRMPLGPGYAKLLDSRVADVANVGGRWGGSVTAAEFLHRFIKDETPWIHLDIAGTASTKSETAFAPKGATGWGVRSLDRLIRDMLET
ncbi:MAG: leucyl aminopeptidase [Pseudomonadota bacterium]